MVLEALHTARDLGRLHTIASVLIRHGLGDVVRRLGMARLLERAGRALHWGKDHDLSKAPEVRVREALEELGPAFHKLGQILAGRSDLLPPAWTEELSRLNERATPVPFERIREQLIEDLGAPPEVVFPDLDPEPLATASIAQVHRASLPDGTPVVLKIRRPGIRDTVEADLRLLRRLADRAEASGTLKRFRPSRLMRQFERSLKAELDLHNEQRNADRLRADLDGDGRLVVPRFYSRWSCERLCVMDYLEGPSIGEWIREGSSDGVDPLRVAETGADAVLHMVFVGGCFHADPHPGNVILMPDGRLGLLDFGMVGFLSDTRRLELLELLAAITTHKVDDMVDCLITWCEDDVDLELLSQDCTAFIDRYYGLPLAQLDVTALLGDLMALVRDNDLYLPGDVALLLKVFVTLDSLGRLLAPGFVMASRMEPFAEAAYRRQNSPIAVVRRGARNLRDLLGSLPRDLRRLSQGVRRGRIRLEIDVAELEQASRRIERGASRMTMGIVTAALIIGTAVALEGTSGPVAFGFPALGLLGFLTSLVLGLGLLWSVFRSGRD